MFVSHEVTWEECKKFWPQIVEIYGATPFTDYQFLTFHRNLTQSFKPLLEYRNFQITDNNTTVGVLLLQREKTKQRNRFLHGVHDAKWWLPFMDDFFSNDILLIPTDMKKILPLTITPFLWYDHHPNFAVPGRSLSGLIDLHKGPNFLQSLNTKKRSYLKTRAKTEQWDSLISIIEKGVSIDRALAEDDGKRWVEYYEDDIWYQHAMRNWEMFNYLSKHHPTNISKVTVKHNDNILAEHMLITLQWKHFQSQVISVGLYKTCDKFEITHATQYFSIQYFWNQVDWYCLGCIDDGINIDPLFLYKTHFRNGNFTLHPWMHIDTDHYILNSTKGAIAIGDQFIEDISSKSVQSTIYRNVRYKKVGL